VCEREVGERGKRGGKEGERFREGREERDKFSFNNAKLLHYIPLKLAHTFLTAHIYTHGLMTKLNLGSQLK